MENYKFDITIFLNQKFWKPSKYCPAKFVIICTLCQEMYRRSLYNRTLNIITLSSLSVVYLLIVINAKKLRFVSVSTLRRLKTNIRYPHTLDLKAILCSESLFVMYFFGELVIYSVSLHHKSSTKHHVMQIIWIISYENLSEPLKIKTRNMICKYIFVKKLLFFVDVLVGWLLKFSI